MKIYIDDYDENLVTITSPKTICVTLPMKINKSLKYHIKFIICCNKSLADNTVKMLGYSILWIVEKILRTKIQTL